jgi:hypothetical protein
VVLLSGCPPHPVDTTHPDSGRGPLPAGHYSLVAILGDTQGTLVSNAVGIDVR